ncbi:hypothetical protein [Kribbella sp. VKM Ac-2566]|uniref:hypothetical protein n=1 Tax=Kribbella sp. VKM Ac-2566 TaxID=2512218 RepID=UPI001062E3CE|nr:hypothetical protein [Kribbella sp. VKM Ac-2566]TDW91126.1 hypothetical protein EV647_4697 [Kribbella sp. VKM Ac-2566]
MIDFAEVVRSLDADDPRGNITAIKDAVKEQLQATDNRVHVDVTDHFNHSFVPDLVLSWPGTKGTRQVFLRTAFHEADIRRDIDTLGAERPILLSLARLPDRDESNAILSRRAKETNSLVADPYGLEVLDETAATKPVVTLLSHAVLQGGRGLMSSNSARASGDSVDAGFDGARAGDPTTTSAAVDEAADLLDSYRASQINRLLHAVWVGSGRPASSFPGAAGLTAILDAESLRFVLDLPDIDDPDFWTRLGSGLTTDRLCELQSFPASENLQRLLAGNAHRLIAKAARVLRRTETWPDSPEWSVAASNLVLRIENSAIHFAPRAVDQLPSPQPDQPAITVDQLQIRAQSSRVRLGEVRLSNGDHVISYGAEDDADVAQAAALASMQQLIPNATLTAATAFAGTKEVRCTFSTRTAAGNSSARFLLSELAGIAVPLFIAPDPSSASSVEAMLARTTREVENVDDAPHSAIEQAVDPMPSAIERAVDRSRTDAPE